MKESEIKKPISEEDIPKLKASMDWAIKRLQELKEKITIENVHLFNVDISEKRSLDPVVRVGEFRASAFRQKTGIVLSIVVEDKTLKGSILGDRIYSKEETEGIYI